jgi:hypothetical protein
MIERYKAVARQSSPVLVEQFLFGTRQIHFALLVAAASLRALPL